MRSGLVFCLYCAVSSALANPLPTRVGAALDRSHKQDLSHRLTWRRLLEVPDGANRSEIASDSFFLATDGREDPQAELEASLRAFAMPVGEDANRHAQCRFPARWRWLKQQLSADLAGWPNVDCPALNRWLRPERLRSISVIMVSGFYGSPAASFGHALIKLNNGEQQLRRGLLDQGANFGAVIPPEDGLLTYVYKGLFGHYQGAFVRNDFYLQDRIYARAQSRDMWEYELELSPEQALLIALHLWEVAGQPFQYFFLRQNCAFRIARLLEIGTGQTLTRRGIRAYPPTLLFHELDQALLGQPRFIASPKRILSAQLQRLSPEQGRIVRAFLRSPKIELLTRLDTADQTTIADVLLDYYDYRLAREDDEHEGRLRDARQSLVALRLKLPAGQALKGEPGHPSHAAPTLGTRPVRLGLSYQLAGGVMRDSQSLRATWFDNALLGRNGPIGSQLRFADLELRRDAERALEVHRFELARAQNLRDARSVIPGERRLSWRVAAGLGPARVACDHCTEFEVRAAAGGALRQGFGLAYALAEAIAASRDKGLAASPTLGILVGNPQRFAVGVETAYRFHPGGLDNATDISAHAVLPIGRQRDLRLNWREHLGRRWSLELNWYW